MKKTPWIAGVALATTLAVAAAAQPAHEGPPKTRAEMQARIAEHFSKADANGDGFVTKAEFDTARTAMYAKYMEHRQKRRAEHFAMLDKDKNGSLSKEEYMAPRASEMGHGGHDGPGGMHDGKHGMMRHGMGGMGMGGMGMGDGWFARADANKDGKLSLAEASAGALAIFDKVDTNHDGTISPAEHDAARAMMREKWHEKHEGPQG